MSGITLNKITKEVHHMLKSSKPKKSKETYYDLLKEQAFSEGTWNDDFISEIKDIIISHINKYSDKEIKSMWEETDISLNTTADPESLPISKFRDDVAEEILNTVFDSLDERTFSEPLFQSKYVDDDEDNFDDDDEFDGFSDDSSEDNEDNFDDEKL